MARGVVSRNPMPPCPGNCRWQNGTGAQGDAPGPAKSVNDWRLASPLRVARRRIEERRLLVARIEVLGEIDARGAVRFHVDGDSTVRGMNGEPVDVRVENFSRTGFLFTGDVDLPVGTLISVGLSGSGRARGECRAARRRGTWLRVPRPVAAARDGPGVQGPGRSPRPTQRGVRAAACRSAGAPGECTAAAAAPPAALRLAAAPAAEAVAALGSGQFGAIFPLAIFEPVEIGMEPRAGRVLASQADERAGEVGRARRGRFVRQDRGVELLG